MSYDKKTQDLLNQIQAKIGKPEVSQLPSGSFTVMVDGKHWHGAWEDPNLMARSFSFAAETVQQAAQEMLKNADKAQPGWCSSHCPNWDSGSGYL